MSQRCHVCGRMGEDCKPCPLCGWVFCEKHMDPEVHDCISLKKPRDILTRLETPGPVSKPAESAESFLANITRRPGESILDENLTNGLKRLGWMLPLYVVGSPLAGTVILMSVAGFTTLIGFNVSSESITMALSLWFMLQTILGEYSLLAAPILMLFLLAVGGGLLILALEYGLLLPAFEYLKRHDASFRASSTLVEISCTGPAFLLIAVAMFAMEVSSRKPVSTIPVILFWTGVALLAVGQTGLVSGLFKLGRKLEKPGFSLAAAMFTINLLLSLALSLLAVIAGLAGWVLTLAACRSVLKKK